MKSRVLYLLTVFLPAIVRPRTPQPIRRYGLIGLSLILFLCGLALGFPTKKSEQREEQIAALFERARTLSDIQNEGGTPFPAGGPGMHIRGGGSIEGHYVKVWQSKDRWRDELTFPRYDEVYVRTKGRMWRQRNDNRQPRQFVQFRKGLNLGVLPAGWKVSLPKEKESAALDCASLYFDTPQVTVSHGYCFDPASGILARADWSDWGVTWE